MTHAPLRQFPTQGPTMTDTPDIMPPPPDLIDAVGTVWTRKLPSAGRVALALSAEHLAALEAFERDRGQPAPAYCFEVIRKALQAGDCPVYVDPVPVTIHLGHGGAGIDADGRKWVLERPDPEKLAVPLLAVEIGHLAQEWSKTAREVYDNDGHAIQAKFAAERAAEMKGIASALDPSVALLGLVLHESGRGDA